MLNIKLLRGFIHSRIGDLHLCVLETVVPGRFHASIKPLLVNFLKLNIRGIFSTQWAYSRLVLYETMNYQLQHNCIQMFLKIQPLSGRKMVKFVSFYPNKCRHHHHFSPCLLLSALLPQCFEAEHQSTWL